MFNMKIVVLINCFPANKCTHDLYGTVTQILRKIIILLSLEVTELMVGILLLCFCENCLDLSPL